LRETILPSSHNPHINPLCFPTQDVKLLLEFNQEGVYYFTDDDASQDLYGKNIIYKLLYGPNKHNFGSFGMTKEEKW
jgi:hypothetical protein